MTSCVTQRGSSQGHSRRGAALSFLGRHQEAKEAFEEALLKEPENQSYKESLQAEEAHLTGGFGVIPGGNCSGISS